LRHHILEHQIAFTGRRAHFDPARLRLNRGTLNFHQLGCSQRRRKSLCSPGTNTIYAESQMPIEENLREGRFIKRYKRFFADVRLGGEVVVAHVPNTGSLKSCLFEDAACLVSESNNPARKLKATLHFLKTPTSWVGVNTSLP